MRMVPGSELLRRRFIPASGEPATRAAMAVRAAGVRAKQGHSIQVLIGPATIHPRRPSSFTKTIGDARGVTAHRGLSCIESRGHFDRADYTNGGSDAKIGVIRALAIASVVRIYVHVMSRLFVMPIYEFECSACGHVFDRLQKLSDPDPDSCPTCGKNRVHRRVTAPSFRLAGSGWYETDFKKDGDKKHNLASKDEAPKSESKPEAKTVAASPAADAHKPVEKPKGKAAETRTASKQPGNAG
jgi:putative FmdB family regulatory protein